MCVAISGRCFLSSHLYNKSANCGECLQPCRKKWKIISEDEEEMMIDGRFDSNLDKSNSLELPEFEDSKTDKTHIFSPKDLCMLEYIPELIEAGIKYLK